MRMCSPHRSGFFELVALGLGLLTASVHASAATGSESFSSEEQSTTGLTRISPAERAELDRQIEREITLAREGGLVVREEPYSIDQWEKDAKSGRLTEAFACGTAAVVTPIGEIRYPNGGFTIGNGSSAGQTTKRLKTSLVDIQRGTAPDPHGWVYKVF